MGVVMTNPDTLGAGPEIDKLVAERVMGWDDFADKWLKNPEDLKLLVPKYSSNIADAWLVVEKMQNHFNFFLARHFAAFDGKWEAIFEGKEGEFVADAPTAPLAICRASLKAVGEKP
jgi:hypothetical protein